MSMYQAPTRITSTTPTTPIRHMPSITVAHFTLRSYVKSGWILGDIVLVWLLYAIFFLEFGGDVSYFFAVANQGMAVVSILGTVVMVQRSLNARVYLPLARLTSRSSYIRGLVLATLSLRVPLYLLMLLLGGGFHLHAPGLGIQGATVGNILLGSLGCILNLMIVSALTVVLCVPIATRRIQIVFLLWLVGVLYSNNPTGFLTPLFTLVRTPLAPLAVCYSLGTGNIGFYELAMVVLAAAYIVGLTYLANFWFKKRDLILQ